MAKFDMMVWYTEEEYGKAWTTIEADSEEEARAIFLKAFDEGKEYQFDWEYHAKGGDGTYFDLDNEIRCEPKMKGPDNE
tara:strand:+ start:2260 stop:2496 length:237 start_codon:yes stop_codon:yes gene_type:complete